MRYNEALVKAQQIEKELTAYDFCFTKMVEIRHGDSTHMYLTPAFVRDLGDDWIVVFTEHNGTHVFHKDDLEVWNEWELKATMGNSITDYPEEDDYPEEEIEGDPEADE